VPTPPIHPPVDALVECVPNFSEGRRPEVVRAIVEAMTTTAPIILLDHSSDADHNRTVVTFVGTPEAVEAASFAGIKTAAALINLDQHEGQHPRIGATDVVPFIPIREVSMEQCIAIAKRLGARVATELNIPVYLYEAAATRPERENLENIRRGEYEGLKTVIGTDPNRFPDFGKPELGAAGATVIGARAPLIAFNVYLTTADVRIAQQIAKAVRMSSGGLRFVKGMGVLVEGRAQVSMNLTNYTKTPIHRVVEMIRSEAQRYGVGIAYSELVGLIPDDALIDAAQWYLQLDAFEKRQLLDRRLAAAHAAAHPRPAISEPPIPEDATRLAQPTLGLPPVEVAPDGVSRFVSEVAAGTPVPGGGSVAALAGALAGALAEMVARLTVGKKKYADVAPEMDTIVLSAQGLRGKLLSAVQDDSDAYRAVMDAYKLDAMHPAREGAIQAALERAAHVPLSVMRLGLEIMRLARTAAEKGNTNAATDAGVSAYMALAGIEGAALNVRVNAQNLTAAGRADALRADVAALLSEARGMIGVIVAAVEGRTGLKN